HRVQRPAPPDVPARAAEVPEQRAVVAAGLLHRVGEDRQAVERLLVVYGLGQLRHHAIVERQPGWLNVDLMEGVADHLAEQGALGALLIVFALLGARRPGVVGLDPARVAGPVGRALGRAGPDHTRGLPRRGARDAGPAAGRESGESGRVFEAEVVPH